MEMLSFSVSTTHSSPSSSSSSLSLLTPTVAKPHHRIVVSLNPHDAPLPPSNIRRPSNSRSTAPRKSAPPPHKPASFNPLKALVHLKPHNKPLNPDALAPKLWLTSKISPPPPPPPPCPPPPLLDISDHESEPDAENETPDCYSAPVGEPPVEFRQDGKIFIGNLPLWLKKHEVSEFFRQFGPIKNVILIKGHQDLERNMGYGFVIYDGDTAADSAMKAADFDGVEFHGRPLTVKLDDGRRRKLKEEERQRWLRGSDERDYRSKWHEDREGSRNELRKVLDTQPDNWQAVVRAFERVKKPSRKEFGLMVKYYAKRGDIHRARETFERMRARGIEPTSHVYTSLIHAYSNGRDMEEALACVRKMKDEGIEMSVVTYSVLVRGFARVGNVESMVQGGKRETFYFECKHLRKYNLCVLPNS